MKTILVVGNETLAAQPTFDAVRTAAGDGRGRVVICVPRKNPRHGNIVYDDAVFDAAQVRIDLARGVLRNEGIEALGEVGDPDAYTAAMDAIAEHHPDEIIVSTFPSAVSGWQRRGLVERITEGAGSVPVTHVEVDVDAEGLPFHVTMVVANKTAGGDQLLDALSARTAAKPQLFIVVVPQDGGEGIHHRRARARMAQMLDRARGRGLLVAGLVGDPDPYKATLNTLDLFRIDDIVISTLPATRSGWLRGDLIDRVRSAAGKPVDHVEAQAPVATAS